MRDLIEGDTERERVALQWNEKGGKKKQGVGWMGQMKNWDGDWQDMDLGEGCVEEE